jgi:hypothetical protein
MDDNIIDFGICLEPECNDDEENKMPSVVDMAKNLFESGVDIAGGVLMGEGLVVDHETQQLRLSICNSCEFLEQASQRCIQCGCFMNAKTHFKKVSCPINKWGEGE